MTDRTDVAKLRLLTDDQRKEFEERGFLTLPGALSPDLVERLLEVHDRV